MYRPYWLCKRENQESNGTFILVYPCTLSMGEECNIRQHLCEARIAQDCSGYDTN